MTLRLFFMLVLLLILVMVVYFKRLDARALL